MLTTEKPKQKTDLNKLLSTRGGTLAVAGVSALLAGALLMVFVNRYRETTAGEGSRATVLVAKKLIEKGSAGDVIAAQSLFERTTIEKGKLKEGAISDPSSLKKKSAAKDIYPGEQLTTGALTDATGRVLDRLTGHDRAISVPVDEAHGLIGDIRTGDRVDVLGSFTVTQNGSGRPVLKTLVQNALVLRSPEKTKSTGGNKQQSMLLRVADEKTWDFAYTADNGKLWIVLRPKAGARQTRPSMVTLETVLFGVKPIEVERAVRRGNQ
jgi:pilus assembly protein CpaB